ncbi:BTAD domain-containing putative transcriptional regulator [Amycolatopsis sp. NPDC052450]|uniref:AfsR/SARP family transcriptional regulator n=1 Tax=Amycolatopsis sp. NPDC052450 TaxID=3363937 RepID=UPI0037C7AB96
MATGDYFYRLLGEPAAEWRRTELPLGPPQARRIFALLLLHAGKPVSRDKIIDELWGDTPPRSAKTQVHGLISGLRRALRSPCGRHPILTKGASYVLDAEPGETDACHFTELTAKGRELLAAQRFRDAEERFGEALALWRGPVLAGVPVAPEVVAHWDDLRFAAVEDRTEAALGLGEHDRLVPGLRDVLAISPFRERACSQLMTALTRAGRGTEALDVYRKWRRRLIDELGTEPSPSLRALHEEILREGPGVTARKYKSCWENTVPAQLPPGIPDFVGREALVTQLLAALAPDPGHSTPTVLLLTGPGGIGKTSLSVQLGRRIAHAYPDGTLYSSLRGTTSEPRSPEVVLGGFLRAFGMPSDGLPSEVDELSALFRSLVHDRRVLIVLDDAADEPQLRPLLPAGPGCAVVVTSRFSLGGLEQGRSVSIDVLSPTDAATLLTRLMPPGALEGDSTAAQQVLSYCGGLPLALRIVGSRVERTGWELADVAKELSVERKRLDWLRAGDLAVRGSVSLGYRQLEPDRQRLFRGIGLLPSAVFPAWAAAAAVDGDLGATQKALEDLRDRHMVQPAGRCGGMPRYRMHNLLRAFASEEAATEPDRATAIERVLGGWLSLAEKAANRLPRSILRPGPGPGHATRTQVDGANTLVAEPMLWFQTELSALEAAVSHAADAGLGELAWEIAVVMASYFDHRGLYPEWWRCHRRALGAARTAGCERGEAALLRGIGQVHLYWDDYEDATATLTQSYRISERIGDPAGMARALTGLCVVSRATGQLGKSRALAEQALQIFTAVGDLLGMVHLYTSHAVASAELGCLAEAEAALDKAWRLCTELDDPHRMALVLRRQGQLELRRRHPKRAMSCLRQALEILELLNDELCAAQVRLDIGRTYTMLGERQSATQVLIDASSQFASTGNRSSVAACEQLLGTLAS